MDIDCDSSTAMTSVPATSTGDVDHEMGVIQAFGEHEIGTDVCVKTMETPADEAETTGGKKISYENCNSFPFLGIIVSSTHRYADHRTPFTFVSNVPVETVANDGSLDDPEWV